MAKKTGSKKKSPTKPTVKKKKRPGTSRKKKINGIEAAGGRGAY